MTGLRIATRAGSPLLHFEGAEAGQRNSVARLQGGGDRVESGIQGAGGHRFGQVTVGGNLIDQLGFFHVYTLVVFQIGPARWHRYCGVFLSEYTFDDGGNEQPQVKRGAGRYNNRIVFRPAMFSAGY